MIRDLGGKVAVVTGGANGIGRALAIGFAAEGMRVIVADIDRAGAQATAERIGSSASARPVDVADAPSVAALADHCFLAPSSFDTGIAQSAAVRPAHFGADRTEDGPGIAAALATITAQGMSPTEVVGPVIEGIRSGEFLIPTRASYAEQLRHRYDALRARELPALTVVD